MLNKFALSSSRFLLQSSCTKKISNNPSLFSSSSIVSSIIHHRQYSNSPSYPKHVIEQKVIEILSKHEHITAQPTKDSHLVKDLGLDSLDSAEIIHEVENEFVLEINDDVAFQLQSVPQIVDFVYKETHHH
ncbi:hypothetical protein FDP41_011876 [Naegleria fowleri]|uniref:Acyl carrier protein n=1 Tax=Naegleria fowleri TaxID=5763 RepID=A0A6A5C9H4_NAEFO|nr:uncharacterized protein FDP41_011876 [Naegleria fowleri]KAF0982015.1 hypothetical protein FDP41_011876 [Naegleria fowleri]